MSSHRDVVSQIVDTLNKSVATPKLGFKRIIPRKVLAWLSLNMISKGILK